MSKNISETNLYIIDWDRAIKLAGNNPDLAKDILILLQKQLPSDIKLLQQALAAGNYLDLKKEAHKLYGAVCYCGLPQLQGSLRSLESALKQQPYLEINSLVDAVVNAAAAVLKISPEPEKF